MPCCLCERGTRSACLGSTGLGVPGFNTGVLALVLVLPHRADHGHLISRSGLFQVLRCSTYARPEHKPLCSALPDSIPCMSRVLSGISASALHSMSCSSAYLLLAMAVYDYVCMYMYMYMYTVCIQIWRWRCCRAITRTICRIFS